MLDTLDLNVGQIVISKSGRDKGRVFIIVEIIDVQYVYIADGKLRKIETPKKKKIKHLQHTKRISELSVDLKNSKESVSNSMIFQEIEKFLDK